MTVRMKKMLDKDEPEVDSPKKDRKYRVMLRPDVKRFVIHDDKGGVLYESGIEYTVSEDKRADLFAQVDDNGVRLFYDAEIVREQIKAALRKSRQQRAAEGDESAQQAIQQEEIDTAEGVTRLRDGSGRPAGVRV